jgi:hypothetical protein
MNKKLQILILFLFSTVLLGCATAYGPHGLTGGYKERQLAENEYIVSFFGNGNTPGQSVWNYWIYRCAELTLDNGYEYFELLPSDEHALLDSPEGENLAVFTMLAGDNKMSDGKARVHPVYYYTTTVTTYSSKGIVKMYKSPVPKDTGLLLDAGVIKRFLSPYVNSNGQDSPPERKDLFVRAAVEAAIRAHHLREHEVELFREQLEMKL